MKTTLRALLLLTVALAACTPVQTEGGSEARISITAPEDGAQFAVGDAVEIVSGFIDSGGALGVILNVEPGFTRQDTFTSPVLDGNANQLWLAEEPGSYVVQVFLNTADGLTIGSQEVHITVGDVTVTELPPDEGTPTATALPPEVIAIGSANCRFGPSLSFGAVTALSGGQRAAVTGQLADGSWWQVQTEDGATCWIFGENVELLGDFGNVPLATSPPTPTSSPTATATPLPLSAPVAQMPSGAVGCVSSVFLTWDAVSHPDGIDHYEWQVSGAANDSGSTSGTQVEVIVACASNYQWRVRAVSNSGQVGAWSTELSFSTN